MTKTLTAAFDYKQLDPDEAGKLECLEREIYKAATERTLKILELGNILIAAQEVLASHKTGTFNAWVEERCGLSKRSAYNYIAAAREFSNCATVAQIEPAAMYALASNGKAKEAALKLVDKGVRITQSKAKELVKTAEAKAKPAADPPKSSAPRGGGAATEPAPAVACDTSSAAPPDTSSAADPPACQDCGSTDLREDSEGTYCGSCMTSADDAAGEPVSVAAPTDPVADLWSRYQSLTQVQRVRFRAMVIDENSKHPSLEDVRAYCKERGNRVDPQLWYDHYTANGWKVGKNTMKDWRAAVRTWEKSTIGKQSDPTARKGRAAMEFVE